MKSKLLLMLLAIALVAGVAQANMLKNPGFEEGSFQTQFSPDNWENYYTSYGQVHTWLSGAGAHSGSKYIKMYNWLIRATSYVTSAWLGQEVLGIQEGKDYTFSVWAKNSVEDQVRLANIYIDWLDSAGIGHASPDAVAIGSDSVEIVVTDANWIEVDFGAFTAPEGAVAAHVYLGQVLANDTNPIFYDDVSMIGPDPNITVGADMISWDGETLSLTGTTSLEGYSTITWSVEPAYAAVITAGDTLTPAVDVDCIIPSGPATIANHSFENDLDNWEIIAGDEHGTWGGYGEPNGLKVFITPTDGLECAYVDGVSDGLGKLSQVLVNTLAANTDYTLSVDVVNDGYYEEDVEYRVQLYAGGSLLAQDNDGQALNDYGVWATSTVNFSTGDDHAALGEQLEIRLVAKAGTAEMNFDNVRLTANPPFPAYVPDVLTLKMKLDIDGKYETMKIDVYPDGCAARLLGTGREPTDPVGDECITNLADLAEMVKTWTDDFALTEPTAGRKVPPPKRGGTLLLYEPLDYPAYKSTEGYPPETYIDGVQTNAIGLTGQWRADEDAVFKKNSLTWGDFTVKGNRWGPDHVWNEPWIEADLDPSALDGYLDDGDEIWLSFVGVAPLNVSGTYYNNGHSVQIGADEDNYIAIDINKTDFWKAELKAVIMVNGKATETKPPYLILPEHPFPEPSFPRPDPWSQCGDDPTADGCPEWIAYQNQGSEFNTLLYVVRIIFGEVDYVAIYMPDKDLLLPKFPVATVTGSIDQSTFDQFRSYVYNGNSGVDADEYRIGTGYDSVVPGMKPSPPDDGYVHPASNLELSWTNIDPNKPGDPVWVDVWFGTEPNDLPPPDPDYDFNKIVDAVEDANSVTVDASVERTYYWQVNSYIYGDPDVVIYDDNDLNPDTFPIIEGSMWKFHAVADAPVSVEVGNDVVTWSGQAVQLAATIDDDAGSALIIDGWSADPNDGVVFDPNEFVEDPTVTITKPAGDPISVTLTFSAQDAVSSDEDIMKIYVYDTPCLAAIGIGQEYDPGDCDTDCDTDLEDYAAMAEQWLVYNGLTESIVKP